MSSWGTRRGVPATTRARIMLRDRGQCQLHIDGCCAFTATEIDHIGDKHDDRDENLRAVCSPCHRVRTMAQSRAGSAANAARRRDRLKLPDRRANAKHPGDP